MPILFHHKSRFHPLSGGFSLVEAIVAVALFAVLVSGITFLIVGSYTPFTGAGNARAMERFAEEAKEVLTIIEEKTWTDIATTTSNALKVLKNASGDWTVERGTETRGVFTRDIRVASVQRNSSGDIVQSEGTDDPATKKIVVTISATGRADYKMEFYLTNIESVRMLQTDWGGDTDDTSWSAGQDDYEIQINMDDNTTTGILELNHY